MKRFFSSGLLLVILLLGAPVQTTVVQAAPKSQLIEFWQQHDSKSTRQIDHRVWQVLLDRYLDNRHPSEINRFNYASVSEADVGLLGEYLDRLQAVDPRELNMDEQKAYWINFYNAATVKVILDNYPVKSIRDIRPDLFAFSRGPWNYAYFSVAGAEVTLNDIEHGILRPIWNDFRLHFVLNCASIGCPNLLKNAFSAKNTERLLDQATRAFMSHPRAVSLEGDTLLLSSLFDWYMGDFASNRTELIKFVIRYANNDALKSGGNDFNIKFHYDWGLNDVR